MHPDKGIDLDDLQKEMEKLLALLKDRSPGLDSMFGRWYLRDRLDYIRMLICPDARRNDQ